MNKNILDMIEYPEEGILSKDIVKNEKIDLGLFCMAAGKEMSDHTSTKAGFVQVIDGKGIFTLEGKEIEMKPGVTIWMDAGAVHGLKAIENTSFVLGLIN